VLIQYQNTFDEYSEVARVLAAAKKKPSASRRLTGMALYAVFFYAATMFWTSYAGLNGVRVFANLVAPVILGLALIGTVATFNSFMSGKFPKVTWRTVSLIGVIGLLVAEFYGLRLLERATGFRTTAASMLNWRMLMPHTTWLFFLAWINIITLRNQKKTLRALWDTQPSLHRMKTTDVSAEGVIISDDKTRLQYAWGAFVGWEETKNLFVLKTSSNMASFLPKRAFGGDEELNAMRALCELIPRSSSPAFPVVTSTTPPAPPPVTENMPV